MEIKLSDVGLGDSTTVRVTCNQPGTRIIELKIVEHYKDPVIVPPPDPETSNEIAPGLESALSPND